MKPSVNKCNIYQITFVIIKKQLKKPDFSIV